VQIIAGTVDSHFALLQRDWWTAQCPTFVRMLTLNMYKSKENQLILCEDKEKRKRNRMAGGKKFPCGDLGDGDNPAELDIIGLWGDSEIL
jgi:hypothetical protein